MWLSTQQITWKVVPPTSLLLRYRNAHCRLHQWHCPLHGSSRGHLRPQVRRYGGTRGLTHPTNSLISQPCPANYSDICASAESSRNPIITSKNHRTPSLRDLCRRVSVPEATTLNLKPEVVVLCLSPAAPSKRERLGNIVLIQLATPNAHLLICIHSARIHKSWRRGGASVGSRTDALLVYMFAGRRPLSVFTNLTHPRVTVLTLQGSFTTAPMPGIPHYPR